MCINWLLAEQLSPMCCCLKEATFVGKLFIRNDMGYISILIAGFYCRNLLHMVGNCKGLEMCFFNIIIILIHLHCANSASLSILSGTKLPTNISQHSQNNTYLSITKTWPFILIVPMKSVNCKYIVAS